MMMSQTPAPSEVLATINRFNDAFNDVDAVMTTMTENCVFENTNPAPDGARHVGHQAVRAAWITFFQRNPDARFKPKETLVAGDRGVVRWIYHKTRNGKPWHLRGVDVFRVRDGKVAEKLSHVKG